MNMEFKNIIFSRKFNFPNSLLSDEIKNKEGSQTLFLTLTDETNGYAIFRTVITYRYKYDDNPDEETTLVNFHFDYTGKDKDDYIEETLKLFNMEKKTLESLK